VAVRPEPKLRRVRNPALASKATNLMVTLYGRIQSLAMTCLEAQHRVHFDLVSHLHHYTVFTTSSRSSTMLNFFTRLCRPISHLSATTAFPVEMRPNVSIFLKIEVTGIPCCAKCRIKNHKTCTSAIIFIIANGPGSWSGLYVGGRPAHDYTSQRLNGVTFEGWHVPADTSLYWFAKSLRLSSYQKVELECEQSDERLDNADRRMRKIWIENVVAADDRVQFCFNDDKPTFEFSYTAYGGDGVVPIYCQVLQTGNTQVRVAL
jgi:hypothetical protein